MRQTFIAAAVAFAIGGIGTGAVLSHAQPPAPPPVPMDGAPSPGPGGPGEWHRHAGLAGGHGWGHRWAHHGGGRGFALIYRQPDRALAPADVQKIAEAFLLWNGNHTWKVTNVTPAADGPIGFSLTTPEGSVVAKFTMDPHTGRVRRSG